MSPTNFCRQMKRQFIDAMSNPGFPAANREVLQNAIDLADGSRKFILPDCGRLHDDKEYKCLDETKALRLPFEVIALEYTRIDGASEVGKSKCSKVIVFAREVKADDGNDFIVLTAVNYIDSHGLWAPFPEVAIPCVGYLDRAIVVNGRVAVRANLKGIDEADISDEIGSLLCFINILSCKNVSTDTISPKSDKKKTKTAHQFDSYYVLKIEVSHGGGRNGMASDGRSPREHLRRGHIRRLHDGRLIWVNATVVASGHGAGAIIKDYAIQHQVPA